MLRVLNCVVSEHDLRLVALSAAICELGCFTTATLMARAQAVGSRHSTAWLVGAAAVFGSSVWSLHFVAMLAFMPAQNMAYDVNLTAASVLVATGGALLALLVWGGGRCGSVVSAGGGALRGERVEPDPTGGAASCRRGCPTQAAGWRPALA